MINPRVRRLVSEQVCAVRVLQKKSEQVSNNKNKETKIKRIKQAYKKQIGGKLTKEHKQTNAARNPKTRKKKKSKAKGTIKTTKCLELKGN